MLNRVKRAGTAIPAVALLVATVAVGSATNSAWAVDVINADSVPREIVVNDSEGQSKVLPVPPRGKLSDVCNSCVVLSGNTSAEATGNMTVRIKGGNVSIGSK